MVLPLEVTIKFEGKISWIQTFVAGNWEALVTVITYVIGVYTFAVQVLTVLLMLNHEEYALMIACWGTALHDSRAVFIHDPVAIMYQLITNIPVVLGQSSVILHWSPVYVPIFALLLTGVKHPVTIGSPTTILFQVAPPVLTTVSTYDTVSPNSTHDLLAVFVNPILA